MITTINQLAANLGVAYPVAANLIALMVKVGQAKSVGKKPAATKSGKGKPSIVYEVPDSFTVQLSTEVTTDTPSPSPALEAAATFAGIFPPAPETEVAPTVSLAVANVSEVPCPEEPYPVTDETPSTPSLEERKAMLDDEIAEEQAETDEATEVLDEIAEEQEDAAA